MATLAMEKELDPLHSCKHCSRLDIKLPEAVKDFVDGGTSIELIFDFTMKDLTTAAIDGCDLCKFLFKGDEAVRQHWWKRAGMPSSHKILPLKDHDSWGDYVRSDAGLGLRPGDLSELLLGASIQIPNRSKDADRIQERRLWAFIEGFGLFDPVRKNRVEFFSCAKFDFSAKYVLGRRTRFDVFSRTSVIEVKDWLSRCAVEHDECKTPGAGFMPSRIIKITGLGNDARLRLCSTKGVNHEPYVALSYCWGGPQVYRTTIATISERFDSIPFKEFPKTLSDAVEITILLGFQYLWIDSQCIIQDDPQDVAREISMMAQVYEHAALTIVGSQANSAESGFLRQRKVPRTLGPKVSLPFQGHHGETGHVMLLGVVDGDPFFEKRKLDLSIDPLRFRAWALQERCLSTRMLSFGTRQTRWGCRKFNSESLYQDDFVGPWLSQDRLFDSFLDLTQRGLEDWRNPEAALQYWYWIVKRYTECQLTVPTDKLPAISAIAQKFSKILGKYLAGLWEHEVCAQLCIWEHDVPYKQKLIPRTKDYCAPSWSWASLDQPYNINTVEYGHKLELVDCGTELAFAEAPFGRVLSGFIKLKGRFREALWMTSDNRHILYERLSGAQFRRLHLVDIRPDALEAEFISSQNAAIPVVLLEVTQRYGLMLRDTSSGFYSRCGIFSDLLGYYTQDRQGEEVGQGEGEIDAESYDEVKLAEIYKSTLESSVPSTSQLAVNTKVEEFTPCVWNRYNPERSADKRYWWSKFQNGWFDNCESLIITIV